jgi:membrane protein implicated in regulation of membrane protease activity
MITDYINNHQAEFWIFLGFGLLAIEVLTGLTTGVLLFGGLGALITGLIMSFGLLPETWIVGFSSAGICTAIVTAALWYPLRKIQGGKTVTKDNSSDLVGYQFILEQDIEPLKPGSKRYSGIPWRVEIDAQSDVAKIAAGQLVEVTSVDVGVFRVKPM